MGIPCCNTPVTVNGEREPMQVFAPHAYDLMVDTPAYKYASNDRVGGIFAEHRRSQERMNVPVIVGEWGSFGDETDDWLPHIQHLFEVFEGYHWSHTYWAYIPGFFEEQIKPFDLQIMNLCQKDSKLTILHICDWEGTYDDLTRYVDYPGDIVNTPLVLNGTPFTVADGEKLFKRPKIGRIVIGNHHILPAPFGYVVCKDHRPTLYNLVGYQQRV